MSEDLLVLSPFAGYATVRHAGGKIHYYYIKKLLDEFSVTIITHIRPDEEENVRHSEMNARIIRDGIPSFFEKVLTELLKLNVLSRYCFIGYAFESLFLKEVKKLYKKGYNPSYIIFDWLQCSFLIKKVKKYFPNAVTVCVEQDVAFLSFYRMWKNSNNFFKKFFLGIKYNTVKRNELKFLDVADDIVVLNFKDKNLLEAEKKLHKEIRVISPYYDNYSELERSPCGYNIIFYGAMGRYENYASARWFIENVLPELPSEVQFIIIGANPDESLLQYEGKRVHITGFVADVKPYFQTALCLVAPLVLGAGIKVKILEAFSAGIPVLTNNIGIEGIPAENGKDFLYCETPQEYINGINKLMSDSDFVNNVGTNARNFVLKEFNYNKDSYLKILGEG